MEILDFLRNVTEFIEHFLRAYFHWLFGGSFYHFLAAAIVTILVIVFLARIWGFVTRLFKPRNQ